MGSSSSQPLRKAGENINTKGHKIAHEEIFFTPNTPKGKKVAVCRCWKSGKFPLCDNTHQGLRRLGCNVGPAMLEVRKAAETAAVVNTAAVSSSFTAAATATNGSRAAKVVSLAVAGGATAAASGLFHFGGFI